MLYDKRKIQLVAIAETEIKGKAVLSCTGCDANIASFAITNSS